MARGRAPGAHTNVRNTNLPSSAVEAIEELQRQINALYSGQAFGEFGRQILSQGIGGSDGSGGGGGGTGGVDGEIEDLTAPPIPQHLKVASGLAANLLTWDPINDRRLGYVEVWRAATNNLGAATMVGTAAGNMFADSVASSQEFFYWVRSVNKWDPSIKSLFNAANGVQGVTGPDIDYLLGLLTGDEPEKPFYAVSVPTTINGVTIQPGVYMKDLYAKAAVVGLFTAGLAVIDSASIISLSAFKIDVDSLAGRLAEFSSGQFQAVFAGKAYITSGNIIDAQITSAKIGDAQITNAKIGAFIQSDDFVSGSKGWIIRKDGYAEIQNLNARGNITANHLEAATGTFIGQLVAASGSFGGELLAGVVDLARLQGQKFEFNTPGTYPLTVPADYPSVRVTLIGGGGGGQAGAGDFDGLGITVGGGAGAGGGAGVRQIFTFSGVTAGTSLSVVVGSGGLSGNNAGIGPGPGGHADPYNPDGNAGGDGGATIVYGLPGNPSAAGGSGGAKWLGKGSFASVYGYNPIVPGASWHLGFTGAAPFGGTGGRGGYPLGQSAGGYGGVGSPGSPGARGGGGGGGAASNYNPNDVETDGGAGGDGYAIVEFFNPNGVVIRSEWDTLITALNGQGILTS